MPSITADGRYVAFDSEPPTSSGATNNGRQDVFVRDRRGEHDDARQRSTAGAEANNGSAFPAIKRRRRLVAFERCDEPRGRRHERLR